MSTVRAPRLLCLAIPFLFAVLILSVGCASPSPPDPALWNGTPPGPYRVGFGLRWETDVTRLYDHKPRPIPVAVWYPGLDSSAPHLATSDYYDAMAGQDAFGPLAARLHQHMLDVITPEQRAQGERFMEGPSASTRDAPSAKGPFPVVIYNPGNTGTYADNARLFEYLATHGYIVLSTSYHCEDPAKVGPCDSAVRERDMTFLVNFATKLANADPARLAAIGVREGGRAVLEWASQPDTPLSAVIAINTNRESHPGIPTLATDAAGEYSKIQVFLDANLQKPPH